jgi:hypothetical protein
VGHGAVEPGDAPVGSLTISPVIGELISVGVLLEGSVGEEVGAIAGHPDGKASSARQGGKGSIADADRSYGAIRSQPKAKGGRAGAALGGEP